MSDRQADAPAVRVGLAEVAVCFVASVFLATIATGFAAGAGAGTDSISFLVAGLVGEWIGFVGGAWLISRKRGTGNLVRDFGLRIEGWGDVGLGLAAGLGTSLIVLGVVYPLVLHLLSHLVGYKVSVGGTATKLWSEGHGVGRVVFALSVAVGAPVAEEVFFRGLLLQALRARWTDTTAIVVCGVLFGLAHASGTESAALPALMIFGGVLAWLAVRTGRLGPGIVAHVVFNAITVIQLAATH
jgi:membrane protease YdiL (CAAX protease family)